MTGFLRPTPIDPMQFSDGKNCFYIKREDLIPFGFGGNKVRIASRYFEDMKERECDHIISYGGSRSNLNRVVAMMARARGIGCTIILVSDAGAEAVDTNNLRLARLSGAEIVRCTTPHVAETVQSVMDRHIALGRKPYYIYGDRYGKGNERVGVRAYIDAYDEIRDFEEASGFCFDYIFLASGTGITQAGLLCGRLRRHDDRRIVGISAARPRQAAREIIAAYVDSGRDSGDAPLAFEDILFEDGYTCGGYGAYSNEVVRIARTVLDQDGIPLDMTYTAKAFYGMTAYLAANRIEDARILFLHTGGLPLFFDFLAGI